MRVFMGNLLLRFVFSEALVKPKFTESAIKVNMPTLSCDFLCCCRNGMTHSVISRHKLLSYDFTSDEWNFGSCTGLCKCVCCLTDKKSLSIMTSDKMLSGLPVYLDFFTDPSNSSTVFPAELPGQIKNYIFSPLNGIADNAQLISHMKKDGIIDKMSLKFKLSDKVSFAAAPMQEALFDVKMGTKGKGQFSAAKFYPSYIDMVYGSNAKCCGGLLTHPCLIQSHEMVRGGSFAFASLNLFVGDSRSTAGDSQVSSHRLRDERNRLVLGLLLLL
jgi:hypothetical protein